MDFSEIIVQTIVSHPFEENAYVVHLMNRKECFAVDTGFGSEKILNFINYNDLKLEAILLTHGHADHIAGLAPIKDAWPDSVVYIGEGDQEKLRDPNKNCSAMFGFPLSVPEADILLQDGETINVAGIPIEILSVPGHSKGHVAYLIPTEPKKILFIGDVILYHSIGRTDFPDGNYQILADSIKTKVMTLPDDTVLFCGHGDLSSVGVEKKYNDNIRRMMRNY